MNLTNLKAHTKDKSNVTQMFGLFFHRKENNVGKGENAGYQHFLLFPQCFQKASSPGLFIPGIVWHSIKHRILSKGLMMAILTGFILLSLLNIV